MPSDVILLMQGGSKVDVCEMTTVDLELKLFPHPKGCGMLTIVLENGFYELQSIQPSRFGSWFINQRVSSNKTMYMASRLDPRFLCLPYFEKSAGKFSPLDQIIFVGDKFARFPFNLAHTWKLYEICDVNDKLGDDMILYRYNEDKVIEWLKQKVQRTSEVLLKQRDLKCRTMNQSFVPGFDASKQQSAKPYKTSKENSTDICSPGIEETKLALEIITDYLTVTLTEKLLQAYKLTIADLNNKSSSKNGINGSQKRKADWEQDLELEKETLAYSNVASLNHKSASSTATMSKGKGATMKTAASGSTSKNSSQMAASAKGTKSIQSFFGANKTK